MDTKRFTAVSLELYALKLEGSLYSLLIQFWHFSRPAADREPTHAHLEVVLQVSVSVWIAVRYMQYVIVVLRREREGQREV